MKKFIRPSLPVSAALLSAFAVWLSTAESFAADTNDPAYQTWRRDYGPTHNERMQWWRAARFGMFIHWGIYSVPAGVYHGQKSHHIGEWLMRDFNIPVAEYAAYARQFDPTNFNAGQWVKIARDAGMKYIVITAKHHDGFAMFHTKVDHYNVYDATPWRHDPLKELAAACRKQGLRLGFYYSEAQDWHHPGGAAANKHPDTDVDTQHHWDPAQEGSMDEYLQNVAVPQIRELLTDYGPGVPAVLWFDTPVGMTDERVEKILPLLKLKPNLIINNRLDEHHLAGDYETPEQHIPPNGIPGHDWETCMTINHTWGYESFDHDFKSAETLLHNLIDIASKGGNYLLNVGPTSTGIIPQPEVERLEQMGRWLKVNGAAIYGTSASPFTTQLPWGRCTQKADGSDTILYLHVWDWPGDGKLPVPGLKNKIVKAYLLKPNLLGWHKRLAAANGSGGVTLAVPKDAPDQISSTIVLKIKGAPEIE
ncbi:MAG: alpha-L-fucosidase [Verrucomicrobiota bacterium]|nr:alpha-L-fucosidase [Verrucomicrobiota bacterium]